MSMDRCDCNRLVDTDIDCGCYIQEYPDGTEKELNSCRCEWCREKIYDAAQNRLDEGDAMAAKAEDINRLTGVRL